MADVVIMDGVSVVVVVVLVVEFSCSFDFIGTLLVSVTAVRFCSLGAAAATTFFLQLLVRFSFTDWRFWFGHVFSNVVVVVAVVVVVVVAVAVAVAAAAPLPDIRCSGGGGNAFTGERHCFPIRARSTATVTTSSTATATATVAVTGCTIASRWRFLIFFLASFLSTTSFTIQGSFLL